MKLKWTLRFTVVALGVLLTSVVWAQPPGGPGGGMRDNPKRDLDRFVTRVGLLEKSGKAKLSSVQAKRIVDAIAPWRSKSAMNETQAKDLYKKLGAVLTSSQTKELQSLRPARGDGGRREGGRRNGGRPGGERGPGGPAGERRGNAGSDKERQQQMQKMQAFFKTYNPFYPPTKYQTVKQLPAPMQEGMKRRYDANIAVLAQLSKKAGKR